MIKNEFNLGDGLKLLGTEMIDADIAKKYLANNKANRKLSKVVIAKYADEMKKGLWRFTTDGRTITFDKNFNLINGQHRLNAIVKANVALEMYIVQTQSEGTGSTEPYDVGFKRSSAAILGLGKDVCSILGFFTARVYGTTHGYAEAVYEEKFYASLSDEEKDVLDKISMYHRVGFPACAEASFFYFFIKTGKKDLVLDLAKKINAKDYTDPKANEIRDFLSNNRLHNGTPARRQKFYTVFALLEGFSSRKLQNGTYQKTISAEIDKWLEGRF